MGDILKPLKRKLKTFKLASFDVETHTNDNLFYLVGVAHDNQFKTFYDVDEFYHYIKTRLKGYFLTATNLSFDLTSAFFNSKYWNEFEIITNGGFMLMAENKNLDIKFTDTLNYHKSSLKELGKIIGLPKLEPPKFLGQKPKNQFEEIELREYNKRDCEITLKFMQWFQNEINKLGGELKITIASCSMDLWKRKFNQTILAKEDYIMKKRGIDTNLKDKIFKAYYGGRTEVLKRGFAENLNYYDFNSLYPSVMVNSLPFPNSVQHIKDGSLKDIINREGVSHVEVLYESDELPLLPYRDGKLIFPRGKFKGWYTHIELRTAIKHGYTILNVFETISYSLVFHPFTKFVNTMFSKRVEAKKKKDSSQLIFKLYMNSLYGKYGERFHTKIKHFDLISMSNEEIRKLESQNPEKEATIDDNGKGYYTEEEECLSSHVFPIFPVYVTAMARIKLWKTARLVDPYYMDTDSIVTKHTLPHSKKLGELDLEHHIDEAIFIKPKMYFFRDGEEEIVKLKGVPRIKLSEFKSVLKGECVKYKKFTKLKESIRRNLTVNSIIEIEKNINLEDNKRVWLEKFSSNLQESKPLVVMNE